MEKAGVGTEMMQSLLFLLRTVLKDSRTRTSEMHAKTNFINVESNRTKSDTTKDDTIKTEATKELSPASLGVKKHFSLYRHTVLPFSKTWGKAKLHGLAVWVKSQEKDAGKDGW